MVQMAPPAIARPCRPRRRGKALQGAAAGLLLALAPTAGHAAEAKAAFGLERHWTSNALDSAFAVPDWYTLLRGSLRRSWGDADATVALGAEFQATRHDTVTIEDDRAAAVSAEFFRRLPGGIELRGTLSYRASSEGDELQIGPLALGMRTPKQAAGAAVQAGFDLGNTTALILEAAQSFEAAGATRFQNGLLPATRLDPDSSRLQFAARLTRTLGAFAFGGSASALLVSVERLGAPPSSLPFSQYGLRGELAYNGADGTRVGLALGAEWLEERDGLYRRARPAWQLAAARPLFAGVELRASYFGRYETADSDDPLASWLRRGEFALALKPGGRLALAAGLACQVKENLLFENEERSRALFAEAVYDANAHTALVLRLDLSRTFKTVIDVRQATADVFVGLRARI